MVEKKIIYPNDWQDMVDLGLDAPQAIDQECLFKKDPIIDLQKSLIKNYMIHYLKQYELRSNINNTIKAFVEKGRSIKRGDLHKPVVHDFKNSKEFENYQSNAQHLYGLYGEWDAVQTNINTIRQQLLDVKRFPKDG